MCAWGGTAALAPRVQSPPSTSALLDELRACRRPGLLRSRIVERQAALLLAAAGVTNPAVPESVVKTIPAIHVRRWRDLPASGMAARDGKGWIIVLNADEPEERRRFTLMHELGHIIWEPQTDEATPHDGLAHPWARSEHDCNYFAACVLMPADWIRADWQRGLRDQRELARRYGVHPRGIHLRLLELGLLKPAPEDDWIRHLLRIRANSLQGGTR